MCERMPKADDYAENQPGAVDPQEDAQESIPGCVPGAAKGRAFDQIDEQMPDYLKHD